MPYSYNLGLAFQRTAAAKPRRTALRFVDGSVVDYDTLNKLSNRVARRLLDGGVGPGDVVAIANSKQPAGYAGMLACLKLGAIYTNFDDQNPADRLRKIFATCGPKLIVADARPNAVTANVACDMGLEVVDLSDSHTREQLLRANPEDLSETERVTGAAPAYIMFTSGSTGVPKGVLISHQALLNFVDWARDCYAITGNDVFTNVNPMYFDNSVFDFYASLFNGASMVPFPREIVANAALLVKSVDEAACTFWFSVPSMLMYLTTMRALSPDKLLSIRAFSFGGEGYPKTSLKILYDLYKHRAEFFNVYGPTECTCICSATKLNDGDFADLHGLPRLGKLARNFGYVLLDGELCLTGPQVGLGYYNDAERTQQSFVANPFNTLWHERMYKTGDIVREDENGDLHFVGRKDNQIKHSGYRIELEEIEAGLARLDYVEQAVALHGRSANGVSRIAAVLAVSGERDIRTVREDLRRFLPEYMVPTEIVFSRELPKNANGKVDRKRLQAEIFGNT
ncbi:amino acid adenylation domain-containing protein [Anaeroselena agilis]|uniref:Amino acid adenylation domain-containing protein n=1 Tax=Anaeroselena agilis TaxID=3063788 RepID=A0ABU3NSD9_9FIRM|nr:amino acid adenylation domain-containing protein [Selenomonadales bacterium 4137-cl]